MGEKNRISSTLFETDPLLPTLKLHMQTYAIYVPMYIYSSNNILLRYYFFYRYNLKKRAIYSLKDYISPLLKNISDPFTQRPSRDIYPGLQTLAPDRENPWDRACHTQTDLALPPSIGEGVPPSLRGQGALH